MPGSVYAGGFAITPDDNADLTTKIAGLYVGGTGNVTVVLADGSTVLFVGAAAGSVLPIQAKRIKSTGTSATLLVGLTGLNV